jgi:Amt family ammonium transporter
MTPDVAELTKQLAETQVALNMVWTLIAGFLVMFMQAGFALLETGLTRAKNVAHTMGMNFLVYALGMLGYWATGFAFQMGGVGALGTFGGDATLSHEIAITIAGRDYGVIGAKGFFLTSVNYTPAVATMFLFQMVFMDTAATVPTGAMAERWKFSSFAIFSVLMGGLIYPIYGNWVWGGGWLSQLGVMHGLGHGHVDFAGSSVVHMTGGVAALIGARALGPRVGKFGRDGTPRAIPGHNVPMAMLGAFILAFGWFGFNAGSSLSAMESRIAIIAVNTMLASAAGALSACCWVWHQWGKPDVTMMANGLLAGAVAITAPCAFVGAPASVFIGAIAGVLVVIATRIVEEKMRVDDPVGAVAVHCVNGTWGVLALGLLADGSYGEGWNGVKGPVRGLLYGDVRQFVAQCVGVIANFVFVATIVSIVLWFLDRLIGNRTSADDEVTGLDVPEMGLEGYPREMLGLPEAPPPPVTTRSRVGR